jgi:hypothetical protein
MREADHPAGNAPNGPPLPSFPAASWFVASRRRRPAAFRRVPATRLHHHHASKASRSGDRRTSFAPVGAENTFALDLTSLGEMRAELGPLVDKVWHTIAKALACGDER